MLNYRQSVTSMIVNSVNSVKSAQYFSVVNASINNARESLRKIV